MALPDEKDSQWSVAIHRERRSLLAVTTVLAFFYLGELRISGVSLLGANVEIGRDSAIRIGIWLVFAYFLARYYQYYGERSGKDPRRDRVVRPLNREVEFFAHGLVQGGRYVPDTWRPRIEVLRPLSVVINNDLDQKQQKDLSIFESARVYIRACVAAALYTRSFTEYTFPLLFALTVALLGAAVEVQRLLCQSSARVLPGMVWL